MLAQRANEIFASRFAPEDDSDHYAETAVATPSWDQAVVDLIDRFDPTPVSDVYARASVRESGVRELSPDADSEAVTNVRELDATMWSLLRAEDASEEYLVAEPILAPAPRTSAVRLATIDALLSAELAATEASRTPPPVPMVMPTVATSTPRIDPASPFMLAPPPAAPVRASRGWLFATAAITVLGLGWTVAIVAALAR